MTLIDYVSRAYQFEEGPAGVLMVRRKTAQALSIFGKGKKAHDEAFKAVSARLTAIESQIRAEYGPASRRDIVQALHDAAEIVFREASRNRRNR